MPTREIEPTVIFMEGNIGSGKSTLVKATQKMFADNKNVYFLQEPVEEWKTIQDENGDDIIKNYYKDQRKYAFKFQMMAYITRLKDLKRALESKKHKVIICERSLYTDKNVFAQMLYDDDIIDEIGFTIYNKWFECFTDILKDTKYLYLRTSPSVCAERIVKRNREGEEGIPIAYLEKIHDYHENWLKTTADDILDGNQTIEVNLQKVCQFVDNIIDMKN